MLFDLLSAIRQGRSVIFENQSERTGNTVTVHALPLKILVSTGTGRRYVCMYSFRRQRFTTFRLDYIKSVVLNKEVNNADELKDKLNNNLNKVWGVSFGGAERSEIICMKFYINEQREQYIIDRIRREGQGGELNRLDDNTFLYTKEAFDSTDMTPWIKTFIGRIIGLEGTNELVIKRFYDDMERMANMYGIAVTAEGGDG